MVGRNDMNTIIMGILLNVCYFSFIRHQMRMEKWSAKLGEILYEDHSVKFDEATFNILKNLVKRKRVKVNAPFLPNDYPYAATISGFFRFLGFIQIILGFVILPISFFFALYDWGVPISIVIIYVVYLFIILRLGRIYICKEVLKDTEKFKFAYNNCIIRLECMISTVSYPDEWVDVVLKWNSLIEKAEAEVKKLKEVI